MSWHFSQALVEAYSEASCLDGEQSAPWNMNPMQQLYSQSDKMIEFLNHSQSGMMCEHLTENHGKELLTWFLEGFHAKTLAVLEEVKESVESDQDCGAKWPVSFAKYDPDTHSWKIVQCSLFEDLTSFLGTWPRWGMMQDGECWEQIYLAPRTREREFGWLPTPTKFDGNLGLTKLEESYTENKTTGIWSKIAGTGNTFRIFLGKLYWIVFGKLMPPVVPEYLMMWPIGWTELKPLGTDKFQQWLDSHGKSSDLDQTKQNHRKIPKKSFKKSSQKGLFD